MAKAIHDSWKNKSGIPAKTYALRFHVSCVNVSVKTQGPLNLDNCCVVLIRIVKAVTQACLHSLSLSVLRSRSIAQHPKLELSGFAIVFLLLVAKWRRRISTG